MSTRPFLPLCLAAGLALFAGCSDATGPVPVVSVSLSATSVRLASGAQVTLTATTLGKKDKVLLNRRVIWTSADPTIATVDSTGKVTASVVTGPLERETTLTATAEDQAATVRVVVEPSVPASLVFGLTTLTLAHGEVATLVPVVKDSLGNTLTGRSVNYVVADTMIAQVNANVVTTGAFLGTTNRTTLVSANAANASAQFTVSVAPTTVDSIAILAGSGFVAVDGQRQLRAIAYSPAGAVIPGVPVTWSSSVTSVATVGTTGLVTAQGEGETTVSAVAGTRSGARLLTVNQCGNGPAGAYPIEIRYTGGAPNAAITLAFTCAVARIRAAIQDEMPPVAYTNFNAGGCVAGTTLNETVPGLLIFATIEPIDGPGRVLGSAGPCYLRLGSNIPSVGRMRFDVADLENMITNGSLKNVIMHEMLHVLGVGTIWTTQSLLVGVGSTPRFTGSLAIDACLTSHAGGGVCNSGVPVEDCVGIPGCGAGTINSHWKEGTFTNELMTGYINAGINPFSRMSIQSLADLGYGVNASQGDEYSLNAGASLMSTLLFEASGGTVIAMPEPSKPLGRVDRRGRYIPMAR